MIFSSKQADRNYFLGKKIDDEATVIKKYRSLKPWIMMVLKKILQ